MADRADRRHCCEDGASPWSASKPALLIDEERYRRLEQETARLDVPVAVLVRATIDEAYPGDRGARADAGVRILDAEPMPVPDPEQPRVELEDLRSRHS